MSRPGSIPHAPEAEAHVALPAPAAPPDVLHRDLHGPRRSRLEGQHVGQRTAVEGETHDPRAIAGVLEVRGELPGLLPVGAVAREQRRLVLAEVVVTVELPLDPAPLPAVVELL